MTDATTCVFFTLDNAATAPVDNNSFWPRRQLRPLPSMTDATTSNLAVYRSYHLVQVKDLFRESCVRENSSEQLIFAFPLRTGNKIETMPPTRRRLNFGEIGVVTRSRSIQLQEQETLEKFLSSFTVISPSKGTTTDIMSRVSVFRQNSSGDSSSKQPRF
ncbi:hypothetical protein C0Q70_11800 [Pomacea canaliculata]|uniref:Uncharacterized protein n=1 Tax=Pomacea canaliculata TaxID=400727 RepID=A0A2T7P733_POMCA|nr:hypothetical protein C0Q70_11800 [Pomacea canaliculata]